MGETTSFTYVNISYRIRFAQNKASHHLHTKKESQTRTQEQKVRILCQKILLHKRCRNSIEIKKILPSLVFNARAKFGAKKRWG